MTNQTLSGGGQYLNLGYGNVVSLYNTNGNWDWIDGSNSELWAKVGDGMKG